MMLFDKRIQIVPRTICKNYFEEIENQALALMGEKGEVVFTQRRNIARTLYWSNKIFV